MKEIKKIEKELFDMVYQWGRVGVVVDHTAPAYKKTIKELLKVAASEQREEMKQILQNYKPSLNYNHNGLKYMAEALQAIIADLQILLLQGQKKSSKGFIPKSGAKGGFICNEACTHEDSFKRD